MLGQFILSGAITGVCEDLTGLVVEVQLCQLRRDISGRKHRSDAAVS
jgi:hypothetical protein